MNHRGKGGSLSPGHGSRGLDDKEEALRPRTPTWGWGLGGRGLGKQAAPSLESKEAGWGREPEEMGCHTSGFPALR